MSNPICQTICFRDKFKGASRTLANASIFAMKIAPNKIGTLDGIPEHLSVNSKSKDSTTSYIYGATGSSNASSSNTDSQVRAFLALKSRNLKVVSK